MSYKYFEIKQIRTLNELPESEQEYIRGEWDKLCNRKGWNTSEEIFFQRTDGRFIKAFRCRINAVRGQGSTGGYWYVQYGNCRHWNFKKNPFGLYDAEAVSKYFSSRKFENGEVVEIPQKIHTKKEVLELAKKLGFDVK